MDAISYTAVRNNLSKTMEKVCNDHSPIIITRQNSDPVIMMSLSDYNSIQETAYLLRSPKNAEKLATSIQELKDGDVIKQNILKE